MLHERMFNVTLENGHIVSATEIDPDYTDIDHEGVVIDCATDEQDQGTVSILDYGTGKTERRPIWKILLEQKLIGLGFIAAGILGAILDPQEGGALLLIFGALGAWMLFTKRIDVLYFRPFED